MLVILLKLKETFYISESIKLSVRSQYVDAIYKREGN